MWSGVNQKYLLLLDCAVSWSFSFALPEVLAPSGDPELRADGSAVAT